jgi:hypothetical protein
MSFVEDADEELEKDAVPFGVYMINNVNPLLLVLI